MDADTFLTHSQLVWQIIHLESRLNNTCEPQDGAHTDLKMDYKCCVPGCRSRYAEVGSRKKKIGHVKHFVPSSSAWQYASSSSLLSLLGVAVARHRSPTHPVLCLLFPDTRLLHILLYIVIPPPPRPPSCPLPWYFNFSSFFCLCSFLPFSSHARTISVSLPSAFPKFF